MYLLRIDSSLRQTGSHSRDAGEHFGTHWKMVHGDGMTIKRDLVSAPVEHISQTTIEGFFTPPETITGELEEALKVSDELVHELQQADTLPLTAPIYNFTVPSALKAWIDHIVRIGVTFPFDGSEFQGLLKTRRAVVICSYGAGEYLECGRLASANFLQPYMTFLLFFLGIGNVEFVSIEATTSDEATVAKNVELAKNTINQLLEN